MLLKLAFFNAACFVVIETLDKYNLMSNTGLWIAYICSDVLAVLIVVFVVYDLLTGKDDSDD